MADDIDPTSPWQLATADGTPIMQEGTVGEAVGGADGHAPDLKTQERGVGESPQAATAGSCGNVRAVSVFGYWSESRSPCALLGGPGSRKTYWWSFEDLATTGAICVAGLGCTPAMTPDWWGAGCGQSGSVTAEWGSVAAYPTTRAMRYGAPLVGYVWS